MNKEIQSLVNQLNAASDAYYNGRDELMTDYEWDAAFDKLKKLEEETGIILPDSPTQNVSADNVAGKKEEHEFPALSLAKTKKVEDLAKWAENKLIWLSCIELIGTSFQEEVWRVLQTIPYGETRTYKEQAIAVGNPKGVRAVANANAKNRISIIVPCHRVIGTNGTLTGYAGGLDRKKFLLDLEHQNL